MPWGGGHIDRIWDTKVFVEAVARWQEFMSFYFFVFFVFSFFGRRKGRRGVTVGQGAIFRSFLWNNQLLWGLRQKLSFWIFFVWSVHIFWKRVWTVQDSTLNFVGRETSYGSVWKHSTGPCPFLCEWRVRFTQKKCEGTVPPHPLRTGSLPVNKEARDGEHS